MIKAIVFSFLFITSCVPKNGEHKPIQNGTAPTASGSSTVDYSKVKPIFEQFCSKCHPSRSAPNWLDYAQALTFAKNGQLHLKVVVEKSMPPPGEPEAASISDQDRQLIETWIASGAPQTAPNEPTGHTVAPTADSLQKPDFASACLACHGPKDAQTFNSGDIPKIAGQNRRYLWHQLMNFKWFDRIDPTFTMNQQASPLSDETIGKLADYFSQTTSDSATGQIPPLNSDDQVLFEKGQRMAQVSCAQCHKPQQQDFVGAQGIIPNLNGQSRNYLRGQLLSYQKGLRKNSLMQINAEGLSRGDIEALSVYFSRLGFDRP